MCVGDWFCSNPLIYCKIFDWKLAEGLTNPIYFHKKFDKSYLLL